MAVPNTSVAAPTLRLVSLVRVSTLGQADEDKTGIPRQHEANERTCNRVGGIWVHPPFELHDVSGSDVAKTSEFRSLIALMEKRAIDGVVIEEFSRLCRPNCFGDFGMLDYFQNNCVRIFTRDGVIDLDKDSENTMAGIQFMYSGQEKRTIKRRLSAGKERKRKNGELPDSKITLPAFVTYERETKKWSYTDYLAKVMSCVEMVEQGSTLRECSRQVGIGHKTIGNFLRNKLLVGIREYLHKGGEEKYQSRDGRQASRKKVLRRPEDMISVQVIKTPALTIERFEHLQRILHDRHSTWTTKRTQYSDDWLNGVLSCGCCDQKMYLFRGKWQKVSVRKNDHYWCRSQSWSFRNIYQRCDNARILRTQVERDVLGFVREHFCSKEQLGALVARCIKNEKGEAELDSQIRKVINLISNAKKEKDRYLTLFGKGRYTDEELDEKVNPINVQLSHDTSLLADLQRKSGMLAATFDSKTIENIVALFSEFEFLAPSEKHRVLSICMPKIRYIGGKGVVAAELNGSVISALGTPNTKVP